MLLDTTIMQVTNFGANLKQLCLERTVARTHNIKIKRNFKKGAASVRID